MEKRVFIRKEDCSGDKKITIRGRKPHFSETRARFLPQPDKPVWHFPSPFQLGGTRMRTRNLVSSLPLSLSLFLFALLGCEKTPIVTGPETKEVPTAVANDLGDEGCFAHEVVWDWSVSAWRDNSSSPTRYYDQDPYYNCPNASEGRGPDWGNDWGDGAGYLYWYWVDRLGDDVFAVVAYEVDQCPLCGLQQIAEQVAEDPVVQQRADEIGEAVVGFGVRAVVAWEYLGPQITAQWHHIMTDKNSIKDPQWTNQFNNLLRGVGLTVATAINNLVQVYNHQGPHPQEYHEYIYMRIQEILNDGGGKPEVEEELRELASECSTPGTYCNGLVTRKSH
jgi:hypothetical protein